MNQKLINAKRIVIKIGSALIVDSENEKVRDKWLKTLAEDVSDLMNNGQEVVIVSSGSIALGRRFIVTQQHNSQHTKLEEKQAAAACGQIQLAAEYQKCFASYGKPISQLLLSIEDSENRRRYLNARNTIDTLLSNKIIPIINENDTVATDEIKFGDNDRLAARVAQMISADVLVLLSDIDGFYTSDPNKNPSAKYMDIVENITTDIERMATGSASNVGSGGMVTKLAAAKIAMQSGCHMVIAKGAVSYPIRSILEGGKASWFIAKETPQSARKHWIAAMILPSGELIIDDGAVRALKRGGSLLPAGVVDVKGKFERGDVVIIKDITGSAVGKGLTAYDSDDAQIIFGKQSGDIESLLGYAGRDVLVHRDDLVLE